MHLRNAAEREIARLDVIKARLEVEQLKRALAVSRVKEIIFDKWIPAAVAATVLFTLVPLANWGVWHYQKKTEFRLLTLQKQMDTYSQVTSLATEFKQTGALLNENKCHHTKVAGKGETWCERLVIKRFEVEPRLVKALRDVQVYFPGAGADGVDRVRGIYNKYPDEPLHQKFLKEFTAEFEVLTQTMQREIQSRFAAIH